MIVFNDRHAGDWTVTDKHIGDTVSEIDSMLTERIKTFHLLRSTCKDRCPQPRHYFDLRLPFCAVFENLRDTKSDEVPNLAFALAVARLLSRVLVFRSCTLLKLLSRPCLRASNRWKECNPLTAHRISPSYRELCIRWWFLRSIYEVLLMTTIMIVFYHAITT